MNQLRRDLFERRLWPVIVVLVVAIVAIPFLISRHHPAGSATLAAAPAATPAGAETSTTSTTTTASTTAKPPGVSHGESRDPFATHAAAGASKTVAHKVTHLASEPAAGTGSSDASTSSGTETSGSGTETNGSDSASGGSGSTATLPSPSSSAPTSTTSTASSNGTGEQSSSSSTESRSPVSTRATGSWTLHSVDISLRTPSAHFSLVNVARLTPLPAASWPKVMFLGIAGHSSAAVFALGDSVTATGPGECRPAHDNCALVVVPMNRTETIHYWMPLKGERALTLKVTEIVTRVTHSHAVAAAAFARHSAAGLCELQLGDPIQYGYDSTTGALAARSATACTRHMDRIPFPGTASRSGL